MEHLKSEASIINVADEKKKTNAMNFYFVIETRSKSDKRWNAELQVGFFII
jgi:hypothetical protein